MTDARHPSEWLTDRRILRLALDPEHFRSFYFAFQYAVANGTDGVIEIADIGLIPYYNPASTEVLVSLGIFRQ
jgi:hypothetical protein